jgi:hypothetical protein
MAFSDGVVIFKDEDLANLMYSLSHLVELYYYRREKGSYSDIMSIRFAIDEGGLKMKVQNSDIAAWTPARGKMEEQR